jgi:hypothetical protein
MSDDDHADRNAKLKAAMRDQTSTNHNTSGKAGVVPCGPSQDQRVKRPTGHVEVGTGKRS